MKEIASLIESGAQAKEVRRIVRAVRLTVMLRRKLRAPVVAAFLGYVLTPASDVFAKLSSYLPKVLFLFSPSLVHNFLAYFSPCVARNYSGRYVLRLFK
ncbi:hypothetical protein GW17_00030515 [Ensete ventricosum]|nr:hypothetical protein GW17_00030515 [Ensete ventricosum]